MKRIGTRKQVTQTPPEYWERLDAMDWTLAPVPVLTIAQSLQIMHRWAREIGPTRTAQKVREEVRRNGLEVIEA